MKKLVSLLVGLLALSHLALSQVVPEEFYIRRDRAPYDTLYRVMTQRNLATYPYATANEIYRAAVTQGLIVRTTAEGCLLPANQPAPLTKPTCTSSVSGPSWASAWYSRSGNVVTVAASGDAKQLKFERADGVAFVANNPDNIVIESGKYYVNGDLLGEGAYTQKWQVKDLPSAPITITVKRNSDNATYSATFTPVDGASRVQLFTASGTTTPPVTSCNFSVSVNPLFTSCGAQVQLVATASGADASNLTYAWASGQTGSTLNLTAPSTNGQTTYSVTVSKAGCAGKTATGTVTVMGCADAPSGGVYAYRGDTFDYTPYADADQNNKFPTFETGNIYVSLALRNQLQGATQPGLGGGIYQIRNKLSANPNHVLVNVPNRYNGDDNGSPDRNRTPDFLGTGQGLGECVYESPKPFYATGETGVTTAPNITQPVNTDPGLGYNPYELGDDFNNTGRLLKFGKSGSTGFYTAMGPMAYGQNRVYLGNEVLMEKWGEVSGRTLMLHYQTTFNRPNFSRAIDKAQEAPCLYVPGSRKFVWYDGTSPYTNDGLTEIIAPVNTGPGGNGLNKGLNGMRGANVFPTENWIANIGENGYGVGLVFYDNIMTSYGYAGDGGADMINPSSGGSWGYIGWNPQEILDYNIKWRHRVKLVVGTVSEIRQEAYNDPYRPPATPKFKFNRAGREGWIFNAGDNDNERHTWDEGFTGNARAGWKVFFSGGGDYSASMSSPGGIWYANQFNKFYIRYKYSGRETQMELKFQRNRQKPNNSDVVYNAAGQKYGAEESIRYANGGADQDGQTVKFAVVGDGQWHTAVVDFAGLPKWTGIISRFVINPHYYVGGKTYQDGESMTIDWINSENSDPFPSN